METSKNLMPSNPAQRPNICHLSETSDSYDVGLCLFDRTRRGSSSSNAVFVSMRLRASDRQFDVPFNSSSMRRCFASSTRRACCRSLHPQPKCPILHAITSDQVLHLRMTCLHTSSHSRPTKRPPAVERQICSLWDRRLLPVRAPEHFIAKKA